MAVSSISNYALLYPARFDGLCMSAIESKTIDTVICTETITCCFNLPCYLSLSVGKEKLWLSILSYIWGNARWSPRGVLIYIYDRGTQAVVRTISPKKL